MSIYMKWGALNGEVTAVGYEKWVQLGSLQYGVGRGISAGTGGGSKREASAPSFSEFTVTRTMDGFSPLLLKLSYGGEAMEVKIDLTQTDNDGKEIAYQKFILTNALCSGYSISSGGDRPTESVSINYTKIDSEYIKIDDKFKTATTGHVIYDIAAATKG